MNLTGPRANPVIPGEKTRRARRRQAWGFLCYRFCYPIRRHEAEQAGTAAGLAAPVRPENIDGLTRNGTGRHGRSRTNRRLQPLGHVSGKAYQALSTHSERTKPEIGTELAPDC
jgi:hypothetical protein